SQRRLGMSALCRVANGFDVMSVGIEHEGAVVIGVVMRTQPGAAVVAPAGSYGGGVERVHQGAAGDAKSDVNRRPVRSPGCDPEIRLGRDAEPGDIGAPALGRGKLDEQRIADRRQRSSIKSLGFSEIANSNAGVIDHCWCPSMYSIQGRCMSLLHRRTSP